MHHRKFQLILMIVIALIIRVSAIRVDAPENKTTSESDDNSNPKAEALTLVIHKFPPKVRPMRVIAPRNDDVVHVYHNSRPKRKPSSRQRRPSNQFRSKIKTKRPSSFGGFKDFGFPPFPTKSSYGEPPRASNKFKFGPPTKPSSSFDSYGFNAQPTNKKTRKQPAQVYGPPPNFNKDFDTNFNHLTINPSTPFDTKTLQTLQQQQSNFPSFSIDTVEPANNFYASSNDFPASNFPLETGQSFNSQKTSYGNPVTRGSIKNFAEPSETFNFNAGGSNFNSGSSNFNTGNSKFNTGNIKNFAEPSETSNFNAGGSNFNFGNSNFNTGNSNFNTGNIKNFAEPSEKLNFNTGSSNFNTGSSNFNPGSNNNFRSRPSNSDKNFESAGNFPSVLGTNLNSNQNSNFPKLPTKYETKDFSTPTRSNPLSANQFLNDFTNFNEVAETQNVAGKNRLNNFNKFNNFDYDFKGQRNTPNYNDEDDEEENVDYLFTSTTTRRPRTRKTTTTEPSTTKRSKKNAFGKRKRPGKISNNHNLDSDDLRDAYTEPSDLHEVALASDDFINQFDSQRQRIREKSPPYLHEIHSTLKTSRKQNALKSALGDDFVNSQIVSIHKSIEKDPNDVDFEAEFGFQRKSDSHKGFGNEFSVGSEIRFGSAEPIKAPVDFNNFPKNHRFS